MIHLQCTKTVLDHFGVKPKELRQAEETDALLGNWSATSFVADKRLVFLFMSDKTLLSFPLLEGKLRFDLPRIPGLLAGGLTQLLGLWKIPEKQVSRAMSDMNVIAVTRTKDRAILGNLVSLADEYQHRISADGGLRSCNLTEIIMSVNDGPQRRLGWSSSIQVTRELFSASSGAA